MTTKVYCSGPLFSPEERAAMLDIANRVEAAGLTTFLPQRDGLEPLVLPALKSPLGALQGLLGNTIDQAIFAVDIFQLIKKCNVIVMNMNGRVPDEGAVAEAAVAWACGKPVVIYKHDARSVFNGADNSMVSQLAAGFRVNDLENLPAVIEDAITAAQKEQALEALFENVQHTVARGERIYALVERFRGRPPAPEELAAKISELMQP